MELTEGTEGTDFTAKERSTRRRTEGGADAGMSPAESRRVVGQTSRVAKTGSTVQPVSATRDACPTTRAYGAACPSV